MRNFIFVKLTNFFFNFTYVYFFEMKYFVLALFLNCKNAWVTFILQYGFENWIINVFSNWRHLRQILESQGSILNLKRNYSKSLLPHIQKWASFYFKSDLFSFLFSVLSESKGFTVFQILVILFLSLFQDRHTFILLFFIKLTGFFCFLFKKLFLSLDLLTISLGNSFVTKGISLALTNLVGVKLFNVSILALQNLLNSSSLLTYIWLARP